MTVSAFAVDLEFDETNREARAVVLTWV